MGIVLALISSALWGIADFAGGSASRRLAPLLVVLASQAAGLTAVVIVASVTSVWGAPTGYLPWAIVAGLVGVTGLLAFYQALATGTMGVVSPIAALGVAVPVIIGLVAGQWPSLIVGIGFALAVAGVVTASGPERSAGRSLRPVVLATVAAVCFGVTLWCIARGAQHSPTMTMVLMRVSSVIALGVIFLATGRRVFAVAATSMTPPAPGARVSVMGPIAVTWAVVVIAGVFDVAANLTFAVASTASALALVAVLGSLYPAVTVLLARVIHHERLTRTQLVGVVIALVGVVLIAGWS